MSEIIACPHCRTRVIAVAGRCPACGQDTAASPRPPPAPATAAPPKRSRRLRHPILNGIGVALIATGLLHWALAHAHGMPEVIISLALIWAGALLILGLLLGSRA